ncbi:ferritin-like domain-containing protein [Pedobacter miscanthi]|jgi:hypothetical protein|uniref:ferritin-like domain-containing protein n=1 Tax=Pedobacter miscanthi TaxID=2259170 RepID=UPI00292DA0A4|nr:ferritin-like domain-containing protein [Pedobacter miscanthi]
MNKNNPEILVEKDSLSAKFMQRREFLQLAGAAALTTTVISCKREDFNNPTTPAINTDNTIDLGKDIGLLNYIYALEQLEAAFYIKVMENIPATFSDLEKQYLQEIGQHELTHREFFKRYLGVAAIGTLEFDFSATNFTTREGVLGTAKTIEDLGVAAYNGVIAKAQELATIVLAGQISSIEARHAAWFRNLVSANSASDLNDLALLGAVAANGLDVSLPPAKVLEQVSKIIKTKLNIINR